MTIYRKLLLNWLLLEFCRQSNELTLQPKLRNTRFQSQLKLRWFKMMILQEIHQRTIFKFQNDQKEKYLNKWYGNCRNLPNLEETKLSLDKAFRLRTKIMKDLIHHWRRAWLMKNQSRNKDKDDMLLLLIDHIKIKFSKFKAQLMFKLYLRTNLKFKISALKTQRKFMRNLKLVNFWSHLKQRNEFYKGSSSERSFKTIRRYLLGS